MAGRNARGLELSRLASPTTWQLCGLTYIDVSMVKPDLDSLADLKTLVRGFADDRDWNQFHTPRNLVLALAGEVGELAATLQWVSDSEVSEWLKSPENRAQFEAELADVFSYLLRLADQTDVDLSKALRAKILVNELRYPQDQSRGSAGKYTSYE